MTFSQAEARTLAQPTMLRGRGLFTDAPASVRILPHAPPPQPARAPGASPGRILLRDARTGLETPALIDHLSAAPVHPAFASLPPRCTCITLGDRSLATVEHVLAALVGTGITHAVVEVEGPELPIFDGSAEPFARAIACAGRVPMPSSSHDHSLRVLTLHEPIELQDQRGGRVRAEPFGNDAHPTPGSDAHNAAATEYRYELDYGPGSPIAAASVSWTQHHAGPGWAHSADDFARRIAPARTFCLESEAHAMRAMGLFSTLSAGDMLVFGDGSGPSGVRGPINATLRHPHEPALHKLLDMVGDLALAGVVVHGRIIGSRSGHALNHALARALAQLTPQAAE